MRGIRIDADGVAGGAIVLVVAAGVVVAVGVVRYSTVQYSTVQYSTVGAVVAVLSSSSSRSCNSIR